MKITNRLRSAWNMLFAMDPGVELPPDSDFWYYRPGYATATGLRVSPESALRVAAVLACVRVVSETIASLPLIIYRSLPNGGKERATDHPLYKLLHDQPNEWQTSYEFIEMMQAHLELRGNAFAVIVPGPKGAIDQLVPLHPDRVQVFRKPNARLRYQVRSYFSGQIDYYEQEEMFHIRGLSSDGLVGMSTVALGAEAIGTGLAAQEFAGRFFENDATPGGVYEHPKTVSNEAYDRLKRSIQEAQTGANRFKTLILEEGMNYKAIGLTNKDSQLLEARQFSRNDIASLWRVPPHKIGDLTRSTFSNIEQQNIEFATDCIRPRLVRLERRINVDLLDPLELNDDYFAEFHMDALLRGDIKSRFEAYAAGINAGFMTRQQVREMENWNPIPGLDKPLMPLNMVEVGSDQAQPQQPDTIPQDDATGGGAVRMFRAKAFLKEIVQTNAARVVRKEIKALRRAEGNPEAFAKEVAEFYDGHADYVAETMRISPEAAKRYTERNRVLALKGEVFVIENSAVDSLSATALGEALGQ